MPEVIHQDNEYDERFESVSEYFQWLADKNREQVENGEIKNESFGRGMATAYEDAAMFLALHDE